ncbi:MAG: VRR-NUC domain-containing protein [Verrucomicrobiota bacterium]
MGKPAQQLTKAVTTYLTGAGVFWWRNSSGGMYRGDAQGNARFVTFGQPGVADLCALYHGHFIAIEIKAGKDTLRDSQKAWLEKVVKSGGIIVVCHEVEDVIRVIAALREKDWLK